MVFSGTGDSPADRDASIEGTAYLTHTLVGNATYDGGLEQCLVWCDGIEGCGEIVFTLLACVRS
jgi:hypothetical protein